MITLYGYWRSTAAYRVRIALNLKQLPHQHQSVHLVKDGGQQHQDDYTQLNPSHLVPTLIDDDKVLNQSVAIIQYLDQQYPGVNLLPQQPFERAIVNGMALSIACEIHPLNNLRVLQHLEQQLDVDGKGKIDWMAHWMALGFAALEEQLQQHSGLYCFGDNVTLADLCLIPQLYNARRFNIELDCYPNILKVERNCMLLDAFIDAQPEKQHDAQ